MLARIFAALLAASAAFAAPKNVIIDTDIGGDIDDAIALAQAANYAKTGEGNLLCVSIVRKAPAAAMFTKMILEYYGLENVPVAMISKQERGVPKSSRNIDGTVGRLAAEGRFKCVANAGAEIPDAAETIRGILARSPDKSVDFIALGPLNNLADLLESKPDGASPLGGADLAEKKLRQIVVMAGEFSGKYWSNPENNWVEYNLRGDKGACLRRVLRASKTPIIFSGYEIGLAMRFPYAQIQSRLKEGNPLREAYLEFSKNASKKTGKHDRPLWDPSCVLYVFAPEFFGLSLGGNVIVDKNGATRFKMSEKGLQKFLVLPENMRLKARDRIVEDVCR